MRFESAFKVSGVLANMALVLASLLCTPVVAMAQPSTTTEIADAWWATHGNQVVAPGVAAALVDGNGAAHLESAGRKNLANETAPDASTVFRIGSLSKSFTALAIMQLRDEGKLHLDDTLETWIPEMNRISYPTPRSPRITLRHLLTHTSGLPRMANVEEVASMDTIIGSCVAVRVKTVPGSTFSYSNLGYAFLGEIVARAGGQSWETRVRERVLIPLGMNRTFFHAVEAVDADLAVGYEPTASGGWKVATSPDLQGYAAAGAIYSNASDLTRFMAFMFSIDPATNNGSVLKAESLLEMQRPQFVSNLADGKAMGFPWFIQASSDQPVAIGHGGNIEGFETQFLFDPERRVGVIVLANQINAGIGPLGEQFFRAIRDVGLTQEKARFDEVASRLLAALRQPDVETLRGVMTPKILDGDGQQILIDAFVDLKTRYGIPDAVSAVKIINRESAAIHVHYANGEVVTLSTSIDKGEPAMITGIWRE